MTVAVTTTIDRFDRYAEPLRRHRLRPLSLPCISVAPASPDIIESIRTAAQEGDRIVITSARAVTAVWPDGSMPNTPVLAVGEATAAAVRRAGGTVAAIGHGGGAELLRTVRSQLADCTVVYPHAAGADPQLVAELREGAARLVAAPVYTTRPVAPNPDPGVDAVVFASPSAIDGWRITRTLRGLLLAAIGATTADHLRSTGAEPDVVAPQPNPRSLALALAARLAERKLV